MFAIIAGFTLICEVGAYILGIPVLSWLYGVNLKGLQDDTASASVMWRR